MFDRSSVLDSSGKKVVLYSSGLDSYILSKIVKPDVLLYCDIGINISESEKFWLNLQTSRSQDVVIDDRFYMGDIQRTTGFMTPLRLTIMNFIGSYYGEEIFGGSLKGEKFLANTEEFEKQTSELLSYMYSEPTYSKNPKKITIKTLFKDLTKGEIIDKYLSEVENASLEKLATETFSCRLPTSDHEHCGECMDCIHKWILLFSRGYDMKSQFVTKCKPKKETIEFIVKRNKELENTKGALYNEKDASFLEKIVKEYY